MDCTCVSLAIEIRLKLFCDLKPSSEVGRLKEQTYSIDILMFKWLIENDNYPKVQRGKWKHHKHKVRFYASIFCHSKYSPNQSYSSRHQSGIWFKMKNQIHSKNPNQMHTLFNRIFTRRVFFTANIETIILLINETLMVFTSNQNTNRNVKFLILKWN